jgi:hypothetical protein
MNVIDVWDCATFDARLMDQLESDADLMLRYYQTDHRIFLEHDHVHWWRVAQRSARSTLWPRFSAACPEWAHAKLGG